MKCRVTITNGNASVDGYVCLGEAEFTGLGFSLNYGFDGDECALSYDGNVLRQTRRGKMRTDMDFIAGERTECFTLDCASGYGCRLGVETGAITYSANENGFKLTVKYTVEDNPMVLNLTAEIIKEKK